MARKESAQKQVRKGNRVREDPPSADPGLVGLSAAPRSTPLHVARLAEEMVVQGVAALVRGLHRQEDPTVLQRQGTCGRTPGLSAGSGLAQHVLMK